MATKVEGGRLQKSDQSKKNIEKSLDITKIVVPLHCSERDRQINKQINILMESNVRLRVFIPLSP